MYQLLKILKRVYGGLLYKTSDYKKGFADCKQLVEIHASKQSGANEALHMRKLLWHSQRERKIAAKTHKVSMDAAIQELEVKRALCRRQGNQIVNLQKKLDERKDVANRQREKIGKILFNSFIPREEKLERIEKLLKSYKNGTTGITIEQSVCETEWWNDVQNT